MADNPYRMSLDELRATTGHAPGQQLVEIEPEVEVPHDLPLRVTPMSPVSEIAAFGQLSRARPTRRPAAVAAAVFLLALFLGLPLALRVRALVTGDHGTRPAPPPVPVVEPSVR